MSTTDLPDSRQWVVLVMDETHPMRVLLAVRFEDPEMAFAYMEERDYPDSMIMPLSEPPDDLVPAELVGA